MADRPGDGVNLVGFFTAEFGQGEVARRIDSALRAAAIPHTTIPYADIPQRQDHPFDYAEGDHHEVNIVCLNAEHLLKFAESGGGEVLADRLSVGVWFWETSLFPDYLRPALKFVDEVWVASDFVAEAISAVTAVPVLTFPLPVVVPKAPSVTRKDLGLPEDRHVFSFVFDFYSTAERKNPVGLIRAYASAFTPEDGAFLVLKTINGSIFPEELSRLEAAAGERDDIRIVDGFASAETTRAYTSLADCSVSLHRSEGFGLTLAEAMALGKPVIATGYSGNRAFMTDENAYLVGYRLTELDRDVGPYPAGSTWADPDLEQAATLMRHVVEHPDEARARGEQARQTILADHSLERTARFLSERVPQLHRRLKDRIVSPAGRAGRFLAQGPQTGWSQPSRLGRLGLLYRRLLLRLLRPYTARQRELEHSIVDGLRELELARDRLEERVRALEAELERQRGGS